MNAMILHERARRFEAEAEQPWFSVKCMVRGSATYHVGRGRYQVGNGQALLLNQDTPYRIDICSAEVVESFVVFFRPEWVRTALRVHVERHERLLDEPFANGPGSFRFAETLYRVDGDFARSHHRLRELGPDADAGERAEAADELLAACVRLQLGVADDFHRLVACRTSTRRELHRRLQAGRDFLLSNCTLRVSLADAASAACLSPYHFARLFRALYGLPPMAFLARERLRRAIHLLTTTEQTVLEICHQIGFESPTSFSAKVKACTGRSPQALRRHVQISKNGEV